VSPAKNGCTDRDAVLPFGLWAGMGPRNHVLDGGSSGAEGRCHGNQFWDAICINGCGYNFRCRSIIASDTVFDSRGGFSGSEPRFWLAVVPDIHIDCSCCNKMNNLLTFLENSRSIHNFFYKSCGQSPKGRMRNSKHITNFLSTKSLMFITSHTVIRQRTPRVRVQL